jgi:hypothetical protein
VQSAGQQRRSAWSNGKHVEQWINSLQDYAFPVIARTPVNLITTADFLKVPVAYLEHQARDSAP